VNTQFWCDPVDFEFNRSDSNRRGYEISESGRLHLSAVLHEAVSELTVYIISDVSIICMEWANSHLSLRKASLLNHPAFPIGDDEQALAHALGTVLMMGCILCPETSHALIVKLLSLVINRSFFRSTIHHGCRIYSNLGRGQVSLPQTLK
jgi:hypothetical protein